MRCRNHSRATKIGQRTWKRNELCSNGVPCRSRIRNLISPTSASASSVTRRPKLTRAELTTERSSAIAPSSRTKPWSSTEMLPSGNTSGMTATATRVTGAYVGASGFSYPSWKPGFYPADAKPPEFLRRYAERLPSVELNTTGYRLPAEGHFERWAAETPNDFRFSVKLPAHFTRQLGVFQERVALLGERLGPIRVAVQQAADPGLLALLFGSLDPALRVAFDFHHESWDGVDVSPGIRVNDWDADAPFRYLRFREPPYSDDELEHFAARIRPLLDDGVEVFAYFRHEDEPTAPRYAEQLLTLLA